MFKNMEVGICMLLDWQNIYICIVYIYMCVYMVAIMKAINKVYTWILKIFSLKHTENYQ